MVITAGRDANLQAAQVEAGSTVDILAERDVNLLSAQDKTNYETMHEELFAGITATVSSSVASAASNIYDAAKKVGEGSSSQSIAMGTIAAINGYYAYDALVNGKPITPGEFKQDGPLLSTSITAGFQYSKNSASGSTSTPVPTTIRAGDTVIIEASSGDINAVGAQIAAGYDEKGLLSGGRGDIALIAGNDINLISAQATTENSSKNVSGGVQINLDLTGGNFNFSKGNVDGTTVTNVNTHVVGTGGVYLQSGNDTNLKGATVTGETVIADIGGDLNIESQLDTSSGKAKQVGVGGGIGTSGAAISGSYQTAKGDAAIVSEQSGIRAGEGGFDIKVDGNTKLKGGVISSEADPKDNRLETRTLEFEDLDTHSEWKADTYGGGISGKGPLVSPPIKEGESETGKALSAVSPGEIIITDPANQQQNIDDLRRDTTDTNTSLPGIPDLQKILSKQLKTQQLYDDAAAKAANMIGNLSSKQYAEATTDAEREFWKEGGTGPRILHAIAGGLLGGVNDFSGMLSGALGGASSAYLAPKIKELVAEFVKEAGLSGSAADFMTNSITGSILQGLGGVTGGTGAAYAGNVYQNNYLKHEEIIAYNDEMRQCGENPDCQYRVFSEYFEISANRNDEVAACETEECRKAHYDDFMKAKEVANLVLNPFNHNNDAYYTALFALQSNDLNSKVNEIAMARVQARNNAAEECGSDAACAQGKTEEYFKLWADEKEHKELLGSVAGAVLGAFNGLNSTKRKIDYDKISTAKPGQATKPRPCGRI
ncbi:hemagglutinin repeat-containing protein [Ochrobactrum quorumnocens]|uniref:hemagglutinin repeat-containing protein n=1 Tax=Ochrobactrum quorumnocens TaxID=271865 RepID=UPI000BA885E6|nr:hemagglutinin repeat-containing protein [[Ochrobactrum] quorumnocens]